VDEPLLLVGVVEEIADATGQSVARRFGYAYVDSFGTVTTAGPAPYLDCVAAPTSSATDDARRLSWLAEAEDKATSWIIANALPEYLAEVQPRRLAELSRTRSLVTKRLAAESERLLLEAAVASEKEQRGEKAKETSESFNRKSEEATTVFLTTQYLEEADVLADRVAIIDHGEIVADDTPANLKAQIGRPTLEVIPVDGGDWAAVSEVLKQFGELVNAANRGIAVRLAPGADDLAPVIRALDGRGLRVGNVQLHAPTLDDVFLAKTGRSLEGAAEEAESEEQGVLDPYSGVPAVPGAPSAAPYQ
jgi:hypothetical protein